MFRFLCFRLGAIFRLFRSRQDLLLENLALRQQLSVLKRRNRRPKLATLDKLFWPGPPLLVWLEKIAAYSHSENGGPLASCRISTLLALDLPGEKTGR